MYFKTLSTAGVFRSVVGGISEVVPGGVGRLGYMYMYLLMWNWTCDVFYFDPQTYIIALLLVTGTGTRKALGSARANTRGLELVD